MTTTTPRLDLPFIEAAQAQKHVTHNAALEVLDLVTQLCVQDFDATTPPDAPVEGQVWALGAGPTGDWAGHDGQLAAWSGGGWLFVTPGSGWRAFGLVDDSLRALRDTATGPAWLPVAGADQGDIDTLPRLGLNATADDVNRLTVAADATLLNHDGDGHQLKINKATAGDTASLLYQTGFSGRAEMGLAGNDDFAIKVSADGSTFKTALQIAGATGQVAMPTSPVRQIMPYAYRYYLFPDRRWTAPSNNPASVNAAGSQGTDDIPLVRNNIKGVFLTAGSRIHGFKLAGDVTAPINTDLDMMLFFQHGPWEGGWVDAAQTQRSTLLAVNGIGITSTSMRRRTDLLSFVVPADGYFFVTMRVRTANTFTGTEYFDCSGALDVACARF